MINPLIRLMLNATFGAKQKKPHSILYTSRMWELFMGGTVYICDFLLQPNVIKNVAFMKNKMTERLNSIWVFKRDWYRVMDDRNGDFLNGQLGRQQMQYQFLKHWIEHLSGGDVKVMGTAREFPHPLGNLSPGLYWEAPKKMLPDVQGGYKRDEMIIHSALPTDIRRGWSISPARMEMMEGQRLQQRLYLTDAEKDELDIPVRAEIERFPGSDLGLAKYLVERPTLPYLQALALPYPDSDRVTSDSYSVPVPFCHPMIKTGKDNDE